MKSTISCLSILQVLHTIWLKFAQQSWEKYVSIQQTQTHSNLSDSGVLQISIRDYELLSSSEWSVIEKSTSPIYKS